MSEFDTIIYSVEEGYASVTLNLPEKHNAMTPQMLNEIEAAMLEADNDNAVHSVLIKGAGPSFSAGYALGDGGRNIGLNPSAQYRRGRDIDDDSWHIEQSNKRLLSIFDMHKPVVAQVHGNCLAGGTDLALLCDIVICSDDAVFGFPAARGMGTLPINMWLYHTSPQWAKRLFLTGDTIVGKDAAKIGLVLKSVHPEGLALECTHLVKRMALIDHHVLSCNKRVLNMGLELMGAKTLQRFAAEMDARGHKARAGSAFISNVKEVGLKAAFRERDEPFGYSMVSVDKPDAQ
ncbi:crotonase/enoyl-CoA hydratase family protein [Haliea sp. E1-2-M8]|uniref:crotonase/enoyl-CoA hydratase family protein n=1 Tax=Haliea sp. E1-2-M8 TaxID=3064706 RepID=UPI0027168CAE|nr:crotonase/enoyl-CoA hydratase family protein [Haliea sp. E1-2-M8]MDO8864001.1 crotonase/enoyl-CoA hydratase family protein [Haliea sp. E1-2-M8]